MKKKRAPSYKGLKAASERASKAARGASKKAGTRCELLLRRELRKLGLRFRVDVSSLPGRPDIVFPEAKVAIFCDGDFWHGKGLKGRLKKLARGHNAPYWVAKIQANVTRDQRHTRALRAAGWRVLRFWESEIAENPVVIGREIRSVIRAAS